LLSWSTTTEGETLLDCTEIGATCRRLSLSKKEGFAKTIQFLKDKKLTRMKNSVFD
jgi:hypothetical protein